MENALVQAAPSGPSLIKIAARVLNRPLLLHPSKAEVILQVLEGRLPLSGAATLPSDANRFVGRQGREDGSYRINQAHNGVAIITIVGSLVNRGAWIGASSGLVSYEGIAAQLREAVSDPEVHSILLDLDTPGGEAGGMFALASLVGKVAQQKRVVALVDDMAASAGYGIASQATEIVVSQTSMVGSIGVVLTHVDRSEELEAAGRRVTLIYAGAHKVDGHPFGPLSAEVQADLQAETEKLYSQFTELVGRGRGSKLDAAAARATEARVFIGQDAVDRGLADRMASFDEVLAEMSTKGGGSAPTSKRRVNMTTENQAGADLQASIDTARKEGASGERSRVAAILRHAEAEGRGALAMSLALDTDMTAEQAAAVMAGQAKASSVPTIADREAALGGAGHDLGAQPPSKTAAADAAWGRAIKNLNG